MTLTFFPRSASDRILEGLEWGGGGGSWEGGVEGGRWRGTFVFSENTSCFSYFSMETYVVGTN